MGRQPVDAIPAQPPVYGLLIAADVVDPTTDGQRAPWERQGIAWVPENIGGGDVGVFECEGNTASLNVPDNGVDQTADPFIVFATDRCSTFGFRARDYVARASRQLLATQSFSIAREFQLGTLRDADGLGNVALKDATLITPSPAAVANAFAELEGAIGEIFKGRRGMIHVTPQVLALAHGDFLLERAGQKWITAQGTIVVADAGYTEEDDGHLYAYASAPVQVSLSDVELTPPSLEQARAQVTDRATNLTTVYAQRLGLVRVDGQSTGTPGDGTADAIVKVQVNVTPWSL